MALCQKCFSSSDHSNHSGCGVVEASNKLKGVIAESIDDFSYDISTIRKHLREVEEVRRWGGGRGEGMGRWKR